MTLLTRGAQANATFTLNSLCRIYQSKQTFLWICMEKVFTMNTLKSVPFKSISETGFFVCFVYWCVAGFVWLLLLCLCAHIWMLRVWIRMAKLWAYIKKLMLRWPSRYASVMFFMYMVMMGIYWNQYEFNDVIVLCICNFAVAWHGAVLQNIFK